MLYFFIPYKCNCKSKGQTELLEPYESCIRDEGLPDPDLSITVKI